MLDQLEGVTKLDPTPPSNQSSELHADVGGATDTAVILFSVIGGFFGLILIVTLVTVAVKCWRRQKNRERSCGAVGDGVGGDGAGDGSTVSDWETLSNYYGSLELTTRPLPRAPSLRYISSPQSIQTDSVYSEVHVVDGTGDNDDDDDEEGEVELFNASDPVYANAFGSDFSNPTPTPVSSNPFNTPLERPMHPLPSNL